jgi:hypothetical protein
MAPPLNIRCEARRNIVRAFEQIGLELFAEPGDGIFVWARFHSGGIGRLVIDIPYLFDFTLDNFPPNGLRTAKPAAAAGNRVERTK